MNKAMDWLYIIAAFYLLGSSVTRVILFVVEGVIFDPLPFLAFTLGIVMLVVRQQTRKPR